MSWWRITTSGAALWLFVLFLSLKEVPGRASSPGTHDKNDSQSRTSWCSEETNACAVCEEAKRPRCLKPGQPLLGADLCECCFSCVALRDFGETCGSQLSTWPEVLGAGPAASSVTILATTRCREGLACVNSVCLDPSGNIEQETSSWLRNDEGFFGPEKDDDASDLFGQDVIPFEAAQDALPTAERYRRTAAPSGESILVNHDDPNPPRTAPSASITLTPSLALSSMESRPKKPQPCFAKREETRTVSSHQFDDMLGRIATANFHGKSFQLVYTGDLLSELEVLLNVVDTFREDSLPDEGAAGFLLDGFLRSSSLSIPDDGDDGTPSNPRSLTVPKPREKRGAERREDDAVGFAPPENIQEILIRGASAHHEYVNGARAGYDQNTDTSDKNASVSSQEDESTVRLHITNGPRKVHTLIDLEEDVEDEEKHDEDRREPQLTYRENAKEAGRLSSYADRQTWALSGTSKPLGLTRTTNRNTVTKVLGPPPVPKEDKPALTKEEKPALSKEGNPDWTKTLAMFNDRLTLVEVRMNFFDKALEEMAKWNNFGLISMTRDCVIPQTSDMRYGRRDAEADEHLVLASGIDPVRTRGSRRKSNGNVQQRRNGFHDTKMTPGRAEVPGIVAARQMSHRNSFKTLIDNGSPRRPPTTRHRGPGRPVKSLCRNPGSSWQESSADVIDEAPAHRTVQRSVPSTNLFSNNSSGLERDGFAVETAPRDRLDDQGSQTSEETQILVPGTSAKDSTILRDLDKLESSTGENIFPEEWASPVEITASSDTPPWKMFVFDEEKRENEPERTAFGRVNPGNLQRTTGRSRRAVKSIDGIQPPRDTPRKISSGSSTKRAGKLFEQERSAKKGPDINRNMWSESITTENAEHKRVAGPLIVSGNSEFHSPPEPMASRLLFSNSDPLRTAELTATPTPQGNQKASYSITDHGNSTIRIEEINETESGEGLPEIHGSSTSEDDFDHIYESVEAEVVDGDFEYDVAYDQVEYVDGSSVEIVTEEPLLRVRQPEVGLKSVPEPSRGGINSVIFPHRRNRRALVGDDQCESGGHAAKRELPLLLFGSSGKHEPKTIVWPSKWTGYRRDRILGSGRSGNQRSTPNSRPLATGALPITTTPSSLPTKTTESLNIQQHLENGEEVTSYVVTPKISGVDRRARKNRRKLVWR